MFSAPFPPAFSTAVPRFLLRILCLLTLGSLLVGRAAAQTSAPANTLNSATSSVFVVAHQDDWQLFMGSRAYDNVQRHGKVVFIILTAGQGDHTEEIWWRSREIACANSARVACSAGQQANAGRPLFTTTTVRGHQITTSSYRNTALYFLRLPDGGSTAQGFAPYNMQTLRKLKNRQISSITSIDGLNTYTSWQDLTSTIRDIMRREVRPGGALWVNSPNPDERHNPDDHPDHLMAGAATDNAACGMDCRRVLYNGYSNARRPANLNTAQTANQRTMFAAYCYSMTDAGQPSGWQPDHLCWIGRQYSVLRHEPAAQPVSAATAAQRLADSLTTAARTLTLASPAPNPCTASSILTYELPRQAAVTLDLYDLRGQLVRKLVDATQQPGHYEVWLDVDQFPASGIYLCRLQVGKEHREQRIQIER